MIGTIVNSAAVIIGSLIGLLFNSKINEKYKKIVFQALGLFTILLGVVMAMKSKQYLIIVSSLVIGSLIGEWLKLENAINKFGEKLKNKIKTKNETFSEGFITAFLMFCMGSMTILGAFDEGLRSDTSLLFTKSVMDGFSSIILSATLGVGVLFAVIPLFIYQGGLTFFAMYLQQYLTDPIVNQMTSVGGILLMGLGISILEIKKIKVMNMTPALIIVIILAILFLPH
jgi:hypothetical protein